MEGCRQTVRMAEIIAGGPEKLRARPFVSFITLMISPFKIDDAYGEMTCYLAQKELPVVVPTEPICGTTSPITLAGNVLTHIAETLAGIAMVQCVKKGAPGIAGSVGSTCNLATMDHLGGSIERAMINAAVAQLAQHFQLPLYSTAGTTDALEVDVQAAYESALSNLLVAMSGANYIHDSLGLMESDLTVSFEKMVLDNEILGMCQRVLRGIEVTDETLAADLIIKKGPGEDFLTEEHTVRHMRDEFFVPQISVRAKRAPGKSAPQTMERARDFVRSVQEEPETGLLPEDIIRKIQKEIPGVRTTT
jgi:trimethylamine---corrinoid protein Co-methyltransferase